MKWKQPPLIKVYEALGALADGRVHVDGNAAKVYSSSGNKFYEVNYDPEARAIMANDNGSYWVGYLGYPSIALLCELGVVKYDQAVAEWMKGVAWKDVNVKFKNDFAKTEGYVREQAAAKPGFDEARFDAGLAAVMEAVTALDLDMLGSRKRPPGGY